MVQYIAILDVFTVSSLCIILYMLAVRRFPMAYSPVSVGCVVVVFHGIQHPQ